MLGQAMTQWAMGIREPHEVSGAIREVITLDLQSLCTAEAKMAIRQICTAMQAAGTPVGILPLFRGRESWWNGEHLHHLYALLTPEILAKEVELVDGADAAQLVIYLDFLLYEKERLANAIRTALVRRIVADWNPHTGNSGFLERLLQVFDSDRRGPRYVINPYEMGTYPACSEICDVYEEVDIYTPIWSDLSTCATAVTTFVTALRDVIEADSGDARLKEYVSTRAGAWLNWQ